jgi:hypothetical protein
MIKINRVLLKKETVAFKSQVWRSRISVASTQVLHLLWLTPKLTVYKSSAFAERAQVKGISRRRHAVPILNTVNLSFHGLNSLPCAQLLKTDQAVSQALWFMSAMLRRLKDLDRVDVDYDGDWWNSSSYSEIQIKLLHCQFTCQNGERYCTTTSLTHARGGILRANYLQIGA